MEYKQVTLKGHHEAQDLNNNKKIPLTSKPHHIRKKKNKQLLILWNFNESEDAMSYIQHQTWKNHFLELNGHKIKETKIVVGEPSIVMKQGR
jgi:hypothetical protein